MAVQMKTHSVAEFLPKVFPSTQIYPALSKLKLMTDAGATVSIGLFNFTITTPPGGVHVCKLPVMSLHIMSGAADPSQLALCRNVITGQIENAFLSYPVWSGGAQSIAVTPDDTPDDLLIIDSLAQIDPVKPKAKTPKAAKKTVSVNIATNEPVADLPDYLKTGPSDKEKAVAIKAGAHLEAQGFTPVSVTGVVPLSEARAVGQAVQGTSKGSSYRVFAVGPVNLAVKVAAGQASIRAEAQTKWLPAQKSKLTALGFSDNGTYMSVHMQLGDIPAIRVLGAVAFSMDMKFSQIATSMGTING